MDACAPSSNAPDQPEAADLPCPFCGYNLHGITSARCPECGGDIDYAAMSQARIPWEHRRQIGRWRAYWRTVVGFTFKPARWATAGATPRYADAVRFRAVTVGVAFGAILLAVLGCRVFIRWDKFRGDEDARWYLFGDAFENYLVELFRQPASLAISLAGILLALVAITGMPAFFFRPASISLSRQSRSLALGQYTCAPLAWLPVTLSFFAITVAIKVWLKTEYIELEFMTALMVLAVLLIAAQMVLWWLGTVRVLRAGTHIGSGRIIACAILQPLASLALLVLIPAALQLVISFVTVVILSLLRR